MAGDAEAVAVQERAERRAPLLGVRALVRAHGVLLSGVAWLLLVLNFTILQFGSTDEFVQYGFVQRLYGDASQKSAYLFGLALLEAPFYGVGKLIGALGLHHPSGHPIEQLTMALALGLATLLIWPLLAPVIRGLELPRPGFSLLVAGIGMPLLYYATFQPTKSHGLETVLSALALYLTFRYFRGDGSERWVTFALGASLGLLCTVRYFDGAEGLALVLALVAMRRMRAAVEVSIGGIVTAGALLAVPLLMGASVALTESPTPGTLNPRSVPISASPLTPVAMLITNRAGLLIWSPIAALAIVGLVSLFRSRPRDRPFLTAACAMAVGLLLFYSVTPWYSGGFGFGQRFLTALMPIVALGVAGAIAAWPRIATAAAVLCTAWTVFLMLNFVTLGVPMMSKGGASGLARVPFKTHISPGAYLWGVRYKSNFLHWTVR